MELSTEHHTLYKFNGVYTSRFNAMWPEGSIEIIDDDFERFIDGLRKYNDEYKYFSGRIVKITFDSEESPHVLI